MLEKILAAMLALPQYVGDRADTAERRRQLYMPVAAVIDSEARGNPVKASALIALAYSESKFARYVLEGRCSDGPRGARCDWDYQRKRPRARGPWQVWGWCTEAWRHAEGSGESLAAEARCAARVLAGAKHRCLGRHPAGDWAGAFSGFRGPTCTWAPGRRRAALMASVQLSLR